MSTEIRFLLAIVLMIAVLVVTNVIFPPVPPEEGPPEADTVPAAVSPPDSATAEAGPDTAEARDTAGPAETGEPTPSSAVPRIPQEEESAPEVASPPEDEARQAERLVSVEGPLYRYRFSARGARLRSAELLQFRSFTRDGPVELIPDESEHALGTRILVGGDTVDLRTVPFEVTPAQGVTLVEGGEPRTLTFTYRHPNQDFRLEIEYTFSPDSYVAQARGSVSW